MSSLSVPFHFTTTFLVAVGAFAGVWIAISRPQFSPRGWARAVFGAGWVFLAMAETIHGAQIVTSDVDARVLFLRAAAYLLLAISLVIPVKDPSGSKPAKEGKLSSAWNPPGGPVRPGLWATSLTSVGRTSGPAVLALAAAVFALRSRLDGARRLALALGLLGASEVFFAHSGAASDRVGLAWLLAHGLHLLGGLALGAWLYRAFRVSIQARFVAAIVLLLVLVVALISATVSNAFISSGRQDAFQGVGAAAKFEKGQIATLANNYKNLALILASVPALPPLVATRSPALQDIASGYQAPANVKRPVDFLAFFAADKSYLGVSAKGDQGQPDLLGPAEVVTLQGSAEVASALRGTPAASVDDVGLSPSKLVVVGAVPVSSLVEGKKTVVGAVAVGGLIDAAFLKALLVPGPQDMTVIGTRGELVASTLRGAEQIVQRESGIISRQVIAEGSPKVEGEASVGQQSYYTVAVPLEGPDGHRVGALLVSQLQSFGSTQRNVSRTLFLGALAATLFAVGASSVSGSRITRPIRDLTAAAEKVSRGDLTARVPVSEADEIGALGEAFNQMTTSLDSAAGELRTAALQESRLRGELETILQSMTDGLIAVDRDSKVLTINREAERIVNMSSERARGKRIEDVLYLLDSGGSQIDLPVYRLGGGSTGGFVGPFGRDRQGIPVAVTSAPTADETGAVTGAVAVLRDLTTELEIEQMKTEFLSNISHELRTPLTPIKGYADLLRRKVVPRNKSVSFLNVIVASTERMERIVDMLVDFSAMQAGRLVVRTTAFDLNRATAELVAKWREAAPHHTFERTGFEDLPLVAGDARLLPRAIDELIDNAVKFSPDGGPVIVHGEMDRNRPDRVRVSVTDHGIGISTEEMSRIFQDFVQVDASETRAFGGLGLGLAYVRRIIEAHDGELQVRSRAGEGSVFTLLIPVHRNGGDGAGRRVPPETPVPVVPFRRSSSVGRRPPPEWPGSR